VNKFIYIPIAIVIWFFYYQMLDIVFMKIQGLSYLEHIGMFQLF
jgi:hypothetical protein